MIPAVLTDFDDTAAVQNVAELLLHEFGDDSWREVRARFRDGELSLKDYQEKTFNRILADRETMCEFVQEKANLRPHFVELWQFCQSMNSPMAVVSLGLDFYIRALLEKEGAADVPVFCVNTRFTPEGISYYYHHTYPGEPERGNSKGLVVDRFRNLGYHVIYVGDGRSDLEGAERADTVFAHSSLALECDAQGIPYRPFTDFGDVLIATRELLGVPEA